MYSLILNPPGNNICYQFFDGNYNMFMFYITLEDGLFHAWVWENVDYSLMFSNKELSASKKFAYNYLGLEWD